MLLGNLISYWVTMYCHYNCYKTYVSCNKVNSGFFTAYNSIPCFSTTHIPLCDNVITFPSSNSKCLLYFYIVTSLSLMFVNTTSANCLGTDCCIFVLLFFVPIKITTRLSLRRFDCYVI